MLEFAIGSVEIWNEWEVMCEIEQKISAPFQSTPDSPIDRSRITNNTQ